MNIKKIIKKSHFIGWYFKQPGIAFIPSIANENKKIRAYIQVITEKFSHTFAFPNYKVENKTIIIGNNYFSLEEINININDEKYNIKGRLKYSNHIGLKKHTMGWYKYIPFLECRHLIHSMMNEVNGNIFVNGEKYVFSKSKGYIESDYGKSFPKEYLWFQCNEFPINIAITFAYATIPILNILQRDLFVF